mgnify:CR=1 FL=1
MPDYRAIVAQAWTAWADSETADQYKVRALLFDGGTFLQAFPPPNRHVCTTSKYVAVHSVCQRVCKGDSGCKGERGSYTCM